MPRYKARKLEEVLMAWSWQGCKADPPKHLGSALVTSLEPMSCNPGQRLISNKTN